MKYKVLLSGKNKTTIDDFFMQMSNDIISATTSERYEDILNHLNYYKPDIFVSCLGDEKEEFFKRLKRIKGELRENNIPFAIVASEDDCNACQQYADGIFELILTKPITASSIENRIKGYLKEKKRQEEEAALAEELRLQEEAARAEEERLALEMAMEKKHVLVVDDDPLMLKAIKEHLREQYQVATATSGKIALKFLEKKTTNLILLDYKMPEEDGPAVLEKLHANDATKDIPVVFLTGITDREKIEKALVLRPQGYLLKPIDHNKLLETIKKLIG